LSHRVVVFHVKMVGATQRSLHISVDGSGNCKKILFFQLLQQLESEHKKLTDENDRLLGLLKKSSTQAQRVAPQASCNSLRMVAVDVDVVSDLQVEDIHKEDIPGVVPDKQPHVDPEAATGSRTTSTAQPPEIRGIWTCVPPGSDECSQTEQANIIANIGGYFPNIIQEVRESHLAAEQTTIFGTNEAWTYDTLVQPWVRSPNTAWRVVWDIVGAALILYDLVTIPLKAFDTQGDNVFAVMDLFTLIFWTVNIPASLLVSYTSRGKTVSNPTKILQQYLKMWFWLDVVVVVPDWVVTMLSMGADPSEMKNGESVKFLRIVRLVRMARILRLATFTKLINNINDLFDTEYASILANIFKMILYLLVINHIVACLWWATSSSSKGGWISKYHIDTHETLYQYLTSFHWSLTQFTPSSMHIQPQNWEERLFAVTIVVFGLVCFSYLVGSITGSLSQLRGLQDHSQFWKVRRFLRQHKVNAELASRIEKYLQHRSTKLTENLSKQQIPIFKHLSQELEGELQASLAVPHLAIHPMFKKLHDKATHTLQRIALNVLDYQYYAAKDLVFVQGEHASHMRFQVGGSCQYTRLTPNGTSVREIVDSEEDWITEQILWMKEWRHRGVLSALSDSDLLTINPSKFCDIVKKNPQAMVLVSNYAQRFVTWFEQLGAEDVSDIFQGEVVTEVMRKMLRSQATRSSLGAITKHISLKR